MFKKIGLRTIKTGIAVTLSILVSNILLAIRVSIRAITSVFVSPGFTSDIVIELFHSPLLEIEVNK